MHENDSSRTFQEMADIQFLLRLPGVDTEEIRGYFERAVLSDIVRSSGSAERLEWGPLFGCSGRGGVREERPSSSTADAVRPAVLMP
jgi:hypothetical protein